ncbi:RabGAP/TBC [Obba rivulosa]|uniref:RabGAP/TBC n=1 Tax=Obba rivulosa TaxID=1052685 RepID=A0A8E2ALL1_9APHY|nr:RabGAP/TBC [Obba rivulosa]
MDFELVRPTILHSPMGSSSVDSLPLSGQGSSRADYNSSLRPSSPAFSTLSGSSAKNPGADRPSESPDMVAHRQRELRWISTMSAVPSAQARKNKKIRKLISEGVPASVRYVVWAYLTDSKAKRINGLYEKFGRRENIPAAGHIQYDVRLYSSTQPEAQEDALTNVLHAYLAMVPDVRYSKGLTFVAGQLLALGPEEDAFWTFVSMMDSHLRPYFSSNPIQLEVDASLFSKAVEVNDASLAKKCYVDMAISPVAICQPWRLMPYIIRFTSVFADALPPEYLYRVWDVFLYEGVPFLFRVGLALLQCCRRSLLECMSQDALLALLSRPPPACLPATPDALLDVAASVKLKDDDVRKQRSKLEAQVKRRVQARAMANISSSISLPRS